MVETSVLFDTNILIDYLNGIEEARTELERTADRAISIITWMEIMVGTTPEDEAQVRAFLATFRTLPMTSEVAEQAVVRRRLRKIKLPDAIIQATAETAGRVLVTRNSRDFYAGEPGIRIPYCL
jgi:predicted nucleic acid-binding protein